MQLVTQIIYRLSNKRPVERAIKWLKSYKISGKPTISHRNKNVVPLTQETAGYLISTLYNYGEKEFARNLAKWEASLQGPDGAFYAIDKKPYTFDTAQVIRGFLTVLEDMPELEENLRRACDYVESKIAKNGEVIHDTYETWKLPDGSMLSEYGNLYVLPPILEAGIKLSEPKYINAAKRGMEYFRKKPDLVEFKSELGTLSHYLGYMMEALVDLGEIELAQKGLQQAADIQKENGAIPAYPGVNWVCSTGVAQLSIAWYKLGQKTHADRAMEYLEKIQNRSGGFYGSYGEDGKYFPNKEISWAVKFFLDAYYWKIKTDFNSEVNIYSESIDKNDGRVKEIMSYFGDLNDKRVLDAGCGKGRYIKILRDEYPQGKFYGLDISDEMLKSCPKGTVTKCGSLLNIGYPDSYFDCAYTIEALEHALVIENAIKEMVRVIKPGGKLIIIDKNVIRLGRLKLKSWEFWFNPDQIAKMLQKYGLRVKHKPIAYEKLTNPDGLFIAWEGIKNA